MRQSNRLVALFCGIVIGVSLFASPAHAEYENKQCKQAAATWKKKHPKATLKQKLAEAEKLTVNDSCNFSKNPKAL
jgi:hypothetical protein